MKTQGGSSQCCTTLEYFWVNFPTIQVSLYQQLGIIRQLAIDLNSLDI